MKNTAVFLIILVAFLGIACFGRTREQRGQSQIIEHFAFEVASVKVNKSANAGDTRMQYLPGGRLTARGVLIQLLIAEAYKVPGSGRRFAPNPDLMKTLDRSIMAERYDIDAVSREGDIPAGSSVKVRNARMRLMLRTLLEDRFKLIVHSEFKEQPVYVLVVAKGGPKLQKASIEEQNCSDGGAGFGDANSCHFVAGGMQRLGIHAQAVDMSDLATALSGFTDRPVIDQTGLDGLYNIQTTGWTPLRATPAGSATAEPNEDTPPPSDPTGPTLFSVLEQLGIKLESQRSQVETVVLDHLERPPQNQ